ncbi:AraC-type DNA-binding protein [Jannaschia seohaensis]|uniref:AraC-like DNA-binding protein n=2 Tax=Jannaschia seohaensis TaxID=475081 RepID=A0A2Y9B843_9RHOB|nr:AraC-like DNA-binding protein [Jannaschia seohaensis]SSA50359.1 AraC-type DNA-binding protein [Jannaschia seohaensis]
MTKSRYHHLAWLHGVEVLEASFTNETFGRHSHEGFAIGAIAEGVAGYDFRGERTLLPPGTLSLMNPEEPHNGFSPTSLLRYNMIYASEGAVHQILGLRKLHGFPAVAPEDRSMLVSQALARLAGVLNQPQELNWKLRVEEAVHDALALCFVRYGKAQFHKAGSEASAIKLLKEKISAAVENEDEISLSTLANTVQLSKSYLIRATRRATGQTPHGLVLKARTEKAHRLLLQKVPAAEAAVASGFYDQAHLIRQYRRRYGVTPGAIIRHL